MADEKDGAPKSAKRPKTRPKGKAAAVSRRAQNAKATRGKEAAPASSEAPKRGSERGSGVARGGVGAQPRRSAPPIRESASRRAEGGARKSDSRGRAAPTRRAKPTPREAPPEAAGAPAEGMTLSEEERIESAKYLPASRPRVFEEERFLFPESYGINRIRLHVKDPEWLFAHWDVSPESLSAAQAELGDRAMALSRLTLRVLDTSNGGASVILLPPGAHSWYVRAPGGQRAYRAELGLTLPSGEFRRLAESNLVVSPRAGPSRDTAPERRTYKQARSVSPAASAAAAQAEQAASVSEGAPWRVPPQDGATPVEPDSPSSSRPASPDAGASDLFRR